MAGNGREGKSEGGRDRSVRVWGVAWRYGRLTALRGSRRWLARGRARRARAFVLLAGEEDDREEGDGLGRPLGPLGGLHR